MTQLTRTDDDRPAAGSPLLKISGLRTHFTLDEGVVKSVDGVDLTVRRGRTLCVVGESGCGKSVTARSILRLIEPPGRIVSGSITWDGGSEPVDLARLDGRGERLRQLRGNEISMIFQEPMASLSPLRTVGAHLVEAIRLHRRVSTKEATERGVELLRRVGIPRPADRMDAYPFQLSGGMCQRVMIALALACDPQLLIADEPTTALDVTTQARIIDLLSELQADSGMAILFITHDLGVVAEIADEVAVMYLGTVVEHGPVDDVFHRPQHPYTRALLRSVPRLGAGRQRRVPTIEGHVPHPLHRPPGCPFHTRCDEAIAGTCDTIPPPTVTVGATTTRCVLPLEATTERHAHAAREHR